MTKAEKKKHNAEYRAANREVIAKQRAEYYLANREEILKAKKEYQAANRKKIAKRKAKHYLANREAILKQKTEYQAANRVAIAKKKAEYYAANRDEKAEYNSEYYTANREVLIKRQVERDVTRREERAAYMALRTAKRFGVSGSWTGDQFRALCKAYDNRCLCCGKDKPLGPDHIIPFSKGGSNELSNIQPLCKPCNSKKRDKCTDYRTKKKPSTSVTRTQLRDKKA